MKAARDAFQAIDKSRTAPWQIQGEQNDQMLDLMNEVLALAVAVMYRFGMEDKAAEIVRNAWCDNDCQ